MIHANDLINRYIIFFNHFYFHVKLQSVTMCKTLCFHRKDSYIKHFYTKHAFIDNSGTAKCLLKMHEVCGHGRYCFYYQYKYIFQYTEACIEYETGFLEF